MNARFLIPLFILVAVGCGQVPTGEAMRSEATAAKGVSADAAAPMVTENKSLAAFHPASAPSRMIVRHAQMTVRVAEAEAAERKARGIVRTVGGFVDASRSQDLVGPHPSITMELRVPVSTFDTALDQVRALGVLLDKSIDSQDVTTQVIDTDARLRSLAAQEETYRSMLRQQGSLAEVLRLQDKLTEVRSTIESLQGQRKALAEQSSFSTISVTFTQDSKQTPEGHDPNWFAEAWGTSISGLGTIGREIAGTLISVVVFSPLWIPIVFGLRFLFRSLRPLKAQQG